MYDVYRSAKIVSQHAEEPIAVLRLAPQIGRHYFRDALIECFISLAGRIIELVKIRRKSQRRELIQAYQDRSR